MFRKQRNTQTGRRTTVRNIQPPIDTDPINNGDIEITEDISEFSSLPGLAHSKGRAPNETQFGTLTPDTSTDKSRVSLTTHMQKEGTADKIWRTVGNFANYRTQRNYDRVMKKRTLQELEDFKEKVEGWANEYRNFIDDGVNRKQPRF